MVSKIEMDQRSSLLPSTVADLISVKVNTSSECYESESLITPSLLSSSKQATTTSLSSSSTLIYVVSLFSFCVSMSWLTTIMLNEDLFLKYQDNLNPISRYCIIIIVALLGRYVYHIY